MKPHVVVTFRPGVRVVDAPHWTEVVASKTRVPEQVHPAVDALLAAHRLPVWATREYRPASLLWSPEEVASGLDRAFRLVLQRDTAIPPALVEAIRLLPVVEAVRVGAVRAAPIPAPRAQALARATGDPARDAIGLPEAHARTRGDPSITVAVLDTGVSAAHPELDGVLLPGRDFVDILDGHADFVGDFLDADADPADEVGHGTHVAGIVAGRGLAMPVGVVPRCRILPVRALGAMRQGDARVGAGLVDNINNAVKWAVDHGADVVNMSLGIRHEGGGLPHVEVVDYARRRGVTIVAAAGNDGTATLYYPGALPYVVAVGAVGGDGRIAAFSTYGDQIALVAAGEDVYSAYLDGGYAFSSGTSQAAPFVAGAVAMLKAHARAVAGVALGDAQLKHVLKHTADKLDGRFKHRRAGHGRLNLPDALRLLEHRLEARQGARREAGRHVA